MTTKSDMYESGVEERPTSTEDYTAARGTVITPGFATVAQIDYASPAAQATQDQAVASAAAQVASGFYFGSRKKKKGAAATLVTDGLGVTTPFNQLGKKTLLGE